jgi:hypothetical protein
MDANTAKAYLLSGFLAPVQLETVKDRDFSSSRPLM